MEDFIAALSLESLPLAVAVNEAAASHVSGTGIEHKERQDRTGQGVSPHQKPDRTSADEALVNTRLHTRQRKRRGNGGAEQHPGNARLEVERERGIL